MNEAIEKLVKSTEHLEFDELSGKVKCTLTGHQMPLNETIIEKYIKGKKFNNARAEFLYKQYSNYLTKTKNNQLFCELTCRFINFSYSNIYTHVNGFNFLSAAENWLKCKKENTEFKPTKIVRKKDTVKFKKMLKDLDKNLGENGADDDDQLSEDDEEIDSDDISSDKDVEMEEDKDDENVLEHSDDVIETIDEDEPKNKKKRLN